MYTNSELVLCCCLLFFFLHKPSRREEIITYTAHKTNKNQLQQLNNKYGKKEPKSETERERIKENRKK